MIIFVLNRCDRRTSCVPTLTNNVRKTARKRGVSKSTVHNYTNWIKKEAEYQEYVRNRSNM